MIAAPLVLILTGGESQRGRHQRASLLSSMSSSHLEGTMKKSTIRKLYLIALPLKSSSVFSCWLPFFNTPNGARKRIVSRRFSTVAPFQQALAAIILWRLLISPLLAVGPKSLLLTASKP